MPTYNYVCESCSHGVEIFHSMNEGPGNCPKCGSDEHMKKVPSNISIQKQVGSSGTSVPGEVVKSSIEEIREDVKREKEALKSRVYTPPGK